MVAHNAEHAPASELASEISREIPEPEEREAFLKRREPISGTRIDSTRGGDNGTGTGTGAGAVRSFNDEVLTRLGENYAEYMGPMAVRLVRHYSANSDSLEQLVESLASEIPDARDSQKFENAWL